MFGQPIRMLKNEINTNLRRNVFKGFCSVVHVIIILDHSDWLKGLNALLLRSYTTLKFVYGIGYQFSFFTIKIFTNSFLKKWAIPGLFFLYFRLFNTQLIVNKCSIYK